MKYYLPAIPKEKQYDGNTTAEQRIHHKLIQTGVITKEEEKILESCVAFYQTCYPALKAIPLQEISDEELDELKEYLKQVFNYIFIVQNGIRFNFVFRVTILNDTFLKGGKLREPKFLTYPPIDIVKATGKYNRANSFESTAFYCSFQENVALMESKPKVKDRIIISTWGNKANKTFLTYPITNTSLIENESVRKATLAFKQGISQLHALQAETYDLLLAFIASEYVKPVNSAHSKRAEYLYSAFFSDQILDLEKNKESRVHDCIIYPSVAWKHQHENLAIRSDVVDDYLQLVHVREYEIEEVYYGKNLQSNEMPVKIKLIRQSKYPNISKDAIIWDDDKI